MTDRLDEIDRRIVYELMRDARGTSAPAIADEVNVSPGTIRNRIKGLEEAGVFRGYTAAVDFEEAEGHLTNLYVCNVPVAERNALAAEATAIPGVVNVRELMTGRRNLHVVAVGEDTEALRRVARALSKLGIEIEDETLVEAETHSPYAPFGPEEQRTAGEATDFISLAGDANVVDVTAEAGAPVVGETLEAAMAQGILDDDSLVIAIERGDEVLTPHGTTTIEPEDVVTVLSRSGDVGAILDAFADGEPAER